ncbi:hypothetical protein MIND_01159800 [Mycena indigotica]|uniref:Uncharacterized protein n=1 Tax=Mycena indigotica TaxID=2126181 RepID=A0A8H6VSU4_9AGAR|nr:uncharacterized protein MIND_01159800 [Mycena indigotica]KAF7292619.1 hypothetical protein MIND_01159800 [Mycena indigotica]
MAANGSSLSAIAKHQQETGTKDKITQYWIERVVEQVAARKAESPNKKKDQIANDVLQWLEAQPGDKMNPLLDILGFDPARDTPIEILHTILLGSMRYVWHHLHTNAWSDDERHLLAIRLESTDISAMNIASMRAAYKVQYRNNLIGKDSKAIMQALVFHAHNICTPEQFQLIKTTADLGAWVWVSVIDDMETYIRQLTTAIANVLDAWDAVDLLRIIVKVKLHLLPHFPNEVRRFGPPVRYLTETQESYNAVFRMCSVFGNNQAPSRDIATKFASMNAVKHILSGGFWRSKESGRWVQSGQQTRQILQEDTAFQRHLGWAPPSVVKPGFVPLLGAQVHPAIQWCQSEAQKHWVTEGGAASTGVVPSWTARAAVLGRVVEIIAAGDVSLVTLERFICTNLRHPHFDWPVIRRPDCERGKCKPSAAGKKRQEREITTHDIRLIKHTDDENFVLNLGCIHNFVEVTRMLPSHAYELRYLQSDRQTFHTAVAEMAQSTRMAARKKTAEKRAATAKSKKASAEEAARVAAELAAKESARAANILADADDFDEEGEGLEDDLVEIDDMASVEAGGRRAEVLEGVDPSTEGNRVASDLESNDDTEYECALPAFEKLLAEEYAEDNKILQDLIFAHTYWHGLAKLCVPHQIVPGPPTGSNMQFGLPAATICTDNL